jgi:hypothetical protein
MYLSEWRFWIKYVCLVKKLDAPSKNELGWADFRLTDYSRIEKWWDEGKGWKNILNNLRLFLQPLCYFNLLKPWLVVLFKLQIIRLFCRLFAQINQLINSLLDQIFSFNFCFSFPRNPKRALVLVTTPFILQLTTKLKLNPIPYLLAIAGATNIGSLATLNGNPQNILIGFFSGITYLEFTQALIIPTFADLIIQITLLWLLYPEIRSTIPLNPPPLRSFPLHKGLLSKTLIITTILLVAFVIGFPLTFLTTGITYIWITISK